VLYPAVQADAIEILWSKVSKSITIHNRSRLKLTAEIAARKESGSLLFGVSATDPATFAAISLLLIVVAFAASSWPSLKAARVDPMEALRME
jgi:ABC-type antimicrobial peptide transport system permease subunit